MFRSLILTVGLALAASFASVAEAATFNFTARIDAVVVQGSGGDIDTTGITAGSTVVSGTFSYVETQSPFFDNGQQRSYNLASATVNLPNQVFSISPSLPDYRANSAGASGVSVYNNAFSTMEDGIVVEPSTLSQDPNTGVVADSRISVSLFDATGTAFNDTSLPTLLSLTNFDEMRFQMWDRTSSYNLPTNTTRLTGTVLSVDVTPVPLPASLPLLGFSTIFAGAVLRRKQKKSAALETA